MYEMFFIEILVYPYLPDSYVDLYKVLCYTIFQFD